MKPMYDRMVCLSTPNGEHSDKLLGMILGERDHKSWQLAKGINV